MIVYSSTKAQFQADVLTNDIGKIILDVYTAKTGHSSGKSEIDSWINSLPFMNTVLNDRDIPDDAGVAIEYHIPQTSKRIDFILTGMDEQQQDTAVLVELKQWQHAELTEQDAIVVILVLGIGLPCIPIAKTGHICKLVDQSVLVTRSEVPGALRPVLVESLREFERVQSAIGRGEGRRSLELFIEK